METLLLLTNYFPIFKDSGNILPSPSLPSLQGTWLALPILGYISHQPTQFRHKWDVEINPFLVILVIQPTTFSLAIETFQYCVSCQLPRKTTDIHPPVKGHKPCLLKDFAIQIIWFIRHDQTLVLDGFSFYNDWRLLFGFMWGSRTFNVKLQGDTYGMGVLGPYISGVGIDINISIGILTSRYYNIVGRWEVHVIPIATSI